MVEIVWRGRGLAREGRRVGRGDAVMLRGILEALPFTAIMSEINDNQIHWSLRVQSFASLGM